MRYMKPIGNFDIFDNDFEDFFKPLMPKGIQMHTDIMETDKDFILEMNVPGYSKEEIGIEFENGYLTVCAKKECKNTDKACKEEKKEGERYIRRERYTGYVSRKFYVGDIDEKDINAKLENGVLTLSFPKESKKEETKKTITIN